MKKEKVRAFLLILTVLLLTTFTGDFAFADDGLYPQLDEAAENSGDENFIKYRDNYYLDSEKMGVLDGVSAMFAGIANFLLAVQKNLAAMQITIFEISMKSNVIELLEAFVEPFITSMKVNLFDSFSLVMISICAFILLIRLAANRQAQALTGLIQAVMIIVVALLYFYQPVLVMEKTDEVTQNISDTVLQAPYEAVYGNGASENMNGKIAALVWNIMVHKPWQLSEFGDIDTAKEYEDEILKSSPDSSERKELVKMLAKEEGLFSKLMHDQIGRVTILFFVGIFNLAIFLFLTFFCGMIMMYRALIMVYMLLGIFVFLLALLPFFGIELLKRWAGRILGACSTKILLSFLLAMILVFMEAIYGLIDTKGLLYTLFTIIVIVVAVYVKRRDIISLFYGFWEARRAVEEVQRYAGQTWRTAGKTWNTGWQMSDRVIGAYNRYQGAASGFSAWRSNGASAGGKGEPGLTVWQDPGKGFSFKTEQGTFYGSGASGSSRTEGGKQNKTASPGTGEKYTSGGYEGTGAGKGSDSMKEAADTIKKSTKEMSQYYKKAELLLQKQYEKSMKESQEKANRLGGAPSYGEFVRRTDAVRGLGAGLFEQRDIAATARILQRIDQKGGDMDRVILGSEKDLYTQVKRPENLTSRPANSGVSRPSTAAQGPQQGTSQEKRGLEYFRSSFGEEKGEALYTNLSSKYGSDSLASFTSSEKLTYSQVLRMVRESGGSQTMAGGSGKNHPKKTGQESGSQHKGQKPVKMRKPGE